MKDDTGGGRTEFDVIAAVRADLDNDLRSIDRRLGLVESTLTTRVELLIMKVDRALDGNKQIFGELKTLADYIVRVLDRTMEVEKRVEVLERNRLAAVQDEVAIAVKPRRVRAGKR